MNWRNWTACIVGSCFILGVFLLHQGVAVAEVAPADLKEAETFENGAAINQKAAADGARYAVSLEQAIQIARQAFAVPGELDQFSSGFSQSEQNSFWNLRWYRNSEPGGEMNVKVDAGTGEIWSMYKWLPRGPGVVYRGLPRYSREQSEAMAAALAQKLQPGRFGETSLQPGSDYVPPLSVNEREQVEYNFYYARYVDGVIYSDNGISVAVNGDTNEVIRFDVNWEEARDFPPPAGKIAPEQAEQVFYSESAPELYYYRPYAPYGVEAPVQLVYKLPESRRQVVIDALTGELLNNEASYNYKQASMPDGAGGAGNYLFDQAIRLNPAEEDQVDRLKNVIPQDEALKIAKSAVAIPPKYVLTSSRLEQDYSFKENKSWEFSWQAGDGSDDGGMDVSVNAVNGELVAFSRRYNRYEDLKSPVVKFSDEEALHIAEDYIEKNQPGRWAQVVFGSLRPVQGLVIDPLEEPRPRAYAINYTRVTNGVKFPQNGFDLEVNSATGEINSYRMTWWDVQFPDPQGVISQEAAADNYLREAPLTLGYLRTWAPEKSVKPREEGKVHLVYYQPNRNFAMLDAFTGRILDEEGKTVTPAGEKESFSDLAGHPAREAVELLAEAGIVTGADGRFRPDDPVTQAELIAMLVKSSGRSPGAAAGGKEPWYRSYYDTAELLGIIRAGEKPEPDAAVNREDLARLAVQTMGLYNVARLSNIYVLDFQDANDISENLRGHAALSVALGLIKPVEGKFEPKAVVTRAEAAETIVRLLINGK
ncbi:S-layer homology domain-containing protein [Pelotomaculum sp. PtaB.Bin117]|uniref:S-layer homology domain-containing protein n=1 Tax=Pelotomaculum sp. PtaB.Bin117 TaxID=1811694 RepID=UPI0009C75596|nr:S-layer homology domain-containing protein [Pelotomaculum sp. PtaB.Bin117]OPX88438.1 MAG: Endo-1,4-beta-xylanase A precursor [Pelotomaculum sp. PtaB.Bin117]